MNSQPEELHRQFIEAFNAGDLLALLALYEPEARLALQSGELRIGHDAIRGALQRFLRMRGTFKLETVSVVEAGEIALLRGNWRLNGTGPDGSPVEMQGNSAEVARRQRDGRWLFVIDQPWGPLGIGSNRRISENHCFRFIGDRTRSRLWHWRWFCVPYLRGIFGDGAVARKAAGSGRHSHTY